MEPGDLRFVTALHLQSLKHGLFPALGASFMRAYLSTFLESPLGFALVAQRDGAPLGFVVGASEERRHYQFVLRRSGPRLMLLGTVGLLLRPWVAQRFIRTRMRAYAAGLVRLGRGDPSPVRRAAGVEVVLSHLAVVPDARGQGVGASLVTAFLDRARTTGATSARVVTLAGSAGAGVFYDRIGWVAVGTFADRDGLTWTRYRQDVT